MPKIKKHVTHAPKKSAPLYRRKVEGRMQNAEVDLPQAQPLAPSHFTLREDGSIAPIPSPDTRHASHPPATDDGQPTTDQPPKLIFSSDSPFVRLYLGNCLELLDAIHARYGDAGRFDCIFADPPYFLSNGGITCHAGKMVKVDKGDWDKSRGPALNHEFNKEWLLRCQRVLKPNGTIWVSGTHHVIFSIGYAMQELGFKILNDIAWEKPNPPPNLSCRYFTHSTETILWAAKNEKSKHTFNYQEMRKVTGKQMKTVWRTAEFDLECGDLAPLFPLRDMSRSPKALSSQRTPSAAESAHSKNSPGAIWTMPAPGSDEKIFGKHPTQKPIALIERCLLASTNPGDLVLDPFLGGGTTAIACVRLNRHFIGIELDLAHVTLARKRADREIVEIWLRSFRVSMEISICVLYPPEPCAPPHPGPLLHFAEEREQKSRAAAACRANACGATASVRAAPPGNATAPQAQSFSNAGATSPSPIGWERAGVRASPQIDLDLFANRINGSHLMDETPQVPTERIFHETKFVFLSCAEVAHGSVVHTTVDVSLQEAWAKTPTGKKRETTHIVRCETEILRIK